MALSLLSGVALAGPGTQTEDDVYVGKKNQVQGVTKPGSTVPLQRPGAGGRNLAQHRSQRRAGADRVAGQAAVKPRARSARRSGPGEGFPTQFEKPADAYNRQ